MKGNISKMQEKNKKSAALRIGNILLPVKKRLIVSLIFILLGAGGLIAARYLSGFADFYGFSIYPVIVNIFGRISDIFPFSLGEIIVIAAVLILLAGIVYFIVQLIRRKGRRKRFLFSSAATLLTALSTVLFIFTYSCGINYQRKPFSAFSGLTVEKYSKEQVCEVLLYVIGEVNRLSEEVELDENGLCIVPDDITKRTAAAMNKLSESYPALKSYYPDAKPVMLSELMCYGQIVGIFSSFSMEANFNTMDTTENMGHTICHELSHMSGFMREDEANFISYLACRDSGDTYLAYSGSFAAMIYLLNAYYPEASREEYAFVYSLIPECARIQNQERAVFWDKYDTDFGEAAEAINDVYLKINDQTDGTKSYGRVVDLLIADYYKNIKN